MTEAEAKTKWCPMTNRRTVSTRSILKHLRITKNELINLEILNLNDDQIYRLYLD